MIAAPPTSHSYSARGPEKEKKRFPGQYHALTGTIDDLVPSFLLSFKTMRKYATQWHTYTAIIVIRISTKFVAIRILLSYRIVFVSLISLTFVDRDHDIPWPHLFCE